MSLQLVHPQRSRDYRLWATNRGKGQRTRLENYFKRTEQITRWQGRDWNNEVDAWRRGEFTLAYPFRSAIPTKSSVLMPGLPPSLRALHHQLEEENEKRSKLEAERIDKTIDDTLRGMLHDARTVGVHDMSSLENMIRERFYPGFKVELDLIFGAENRERLRAALTDFSQRSGLPVEILSPEHILERARSLDEHEIYSYLHDSDYDSDYD